ncbi:MAG: UDP-glucose 4-epimerase [Chlamydiales bacterium]|nr:UDP-glucose 4-epimerase [Chlamydiales bacterium]
MKPIIVTGGAGYIGSHVAKQLAQSDFLPICLDNLSTGYREAVKWGPLEVGDLQDKAFVSKVLTSYKPLAVMHFAASCYVNESEKKPYKYYKNNVLTTLNLLEAMKENHVKRLIFSSSCATYGTPTVVPIHEMVEQRPINTYGKTKLICEQMIHDASKSEGLQSVILRYFNAAGADLDEEIGESHNPETHLIPLILRALLEERPIQVFGSDYPTQDGTAVRDYVHVQDLATAHVQALLFLMESKESIICNLGLGKGYSIKQVITACEQILHKKACIELRERRAGDPAILVADASYARKKLGWEPALSDLSTLINSAAGWQRKLLAEKVTDLPIKAGCKV